MATDPAESPQDVGDVCAEDAAQNVELVDHHHPESHEEGVPLLVPGEEPTVQHFRVGEDDVGVVAYPGLLLRGGVAVVGAGHEAGKVEGGERTQLIVGERFGGIEEKCRTGRDRIGDGLGDRDLKAPGLARRRAGGDHDMFTASDRVDRLGLVMPQVLCVGPIGKARGQGSLEPAMAFGARFEVLHVHQASVGIEFVEERLERGGRVRREGHRPMLRQPCDRITCMWSDTVPRVDIVVHTHVADPWSVLTVAGELDVVGAPELRQHVIQVVRDGHHRLVLDLTGVAFVDSFGLGVLVGALKRVRLLDGDLRLVIGEPRVRRVLEVCDLDRVFAIHTDLDSAVAAA